ncbi:Biotin carboxyl carrier protein of acetyl-CoA carboxylase [Heracleum sosnowskyi]|uniref:Biotin carboxyl carrier protein of acetyl-CoA carboxylase n=1 Tax=Heracleum sosnowskyi TaxID=360622 RepID=A0AAD8JGV1_9APIA|nr:Biotin carboxyl carrier protein of acetyl-CoA carboxylase [Heracleum sosnowskyi]
MASSSSLATTAKSKVNSSCYPPVCKPHYYLSHSNLSFRLSSPNPFIRLQAKGFQSSWNRSTLVKAQLNEVADGSSNSAATSSSKAESQVTEDKDAKSSTEPGPASEEAISEFIAQVKNLVKLVDSRDIVELQLKQLDCELTIRKIEALPQPAAPAPIMMHAPAQPPTFQAASPPAPSAPSGPAAPSGPPSAAAPPALKPAKSSHPPLKCPMAGMFYRSPAPGEPAFVKVGDKVQKGQVLCIIEAMKLMNEIEADHSGTLTEILVDDGKPVSVDMPLFVIEP